MANSLMDMLQGQLTETVISQLASQVGGKPDQTYAAANGIFSTLIGALNKNSQTQEGAQSLFNALERDHDGGVLNNVMDLIGGNMNNKSSDGMGIIGHLLGDNAGGIASLIGKESGMDSNSTMNLMVKLAPMVMGLLGKQRNEQGLDVSGLLGLLTQEKKNVQDRNDNLDGFMKFLDMDGDGNAMDDIMNIGGKLLSGFLKR